MSDQSPPKPKPGSLRDRIAAFEKSASTTPAPGPAPGVRPKPAGFASWKPKAPSPPSSPNPATTEHASSSTVRAAGMSASDAKESITKAGGSVRDRMAALQGKGAFGAPPPIAPKPVEKPKWKPPPVVQAPIDDDDDHRDVVSTITTTVERTLSPPASSKSPEPVGAPSSDEPGVIASTRIEAEGDNEGELAALAPEEEERQRRAAIAARMARLGGARLGMAPPVFGKKPPVRRPTQEDVPKPEETKVVVEPPKQDISATEAREELSPPPTDAVASPPTESLVHGQTEPQARESQEYFPVRKDSENVSILSADSTDSHPSRSPSSMPIPAVPRRAGPPRKKSAKPTLSTPEVPDQQPEEAASVEAIPAEAEDVETAFAPADHVPVSKPDSPGSAHEHIASPAVEKLTSQITGESAHSPASEFLTEEEPTIHIKEETEIISLASEIELPSASPIIEQSSDVVSHSPRVEDEDDDNGDKSDYEDEPEPEPVDVSISPPAPEILALPHVFSTELSKPHDSLVDQASTPVPVAALEEDSDMGEEEARKKLVADRVAKMGGINPFALPSQVKPAPEAVHSPPPALVSSPVVPAIADEANKFSEPISPSSEDEPFGHKESVVEVDAVEEAFAEDKVEDDDILDETQAEPTTTIESHDKPVTPTLPHSEFHGDSANYASRSPPVPSLEKRSPVQVQQYKGEGGDTSDYDSVAGISVPLIPASSILRSAPSGHSGVAPLPPARPAQPRISSYGAAIPLSSPSISNPTSEDQLRDNIERPMQPPLRIISQSEEDEDEGTDEEDERLATSHLFIPPPTGRRPMAIPRHVQAELEDDGNGSESDSPALPILNRRSLDMPPRRSVPPPPPMQPPALVGEDSEQESDHDGQPLPVPPRRTSGPPPRAVPPPPALQNDDQGIAFHPAPIRRTLPPAPAEVVVAHSPTSDRLTPLSIPNSDEILDEEEGDPIDPIFHSPSRRNSLENIRVVADAQTRPDATQITPVPVPIPSPSSPVAPTTQTAPEETEEPGEDQEQLRRKTIAERMAKLGGIRFGGAIPTPASRPPQLTRQEHEQEEVQDDESAPDKTPAAMSEEEEERARKERIAAKMASMGGMRIGMMPMGAGMPPQKSHVLRDEDIARSPPAPVPPARPLPPAHSPPPPTTTRGPDTDSDNGTEDGVKVEAEDSDMEQVDYEDAEEPEEAPPPVPSRDGRPQSYRELAPSSPTPIPSPRPPVPTSIPTRRSSVKTTESTGGDLGTNPSRKTSYMPQSEYVMVEEPEIQETSPPPPPARPAGHLPPARSTPQIPQTVRTMSQSSDANDSIYSAWELPSMPTPALGGADLSLSWTDAGEPTSLATSASPPPPPTKKHSLSSSADRRLSADDLMALWGRVGVQVCEVATSLFETSRKSLVGDGSYAGFLQVVMAAVPNAASVPSESGEYGYLIYAQNGPTVQKRASEIMPGDIVEINDAKLKGHKGIQTYHQSVGGAGGEILLGVVGEYEPKKSKVRVFHANQHVGQQTVESVSYRLEDLKSGTVKIYRVLDA